MTETDIDLNGAVEADSFMKLLNKTKDEEIKIDASEEGEVKIKGKNFSAGLQFDSEIKLPIDDIDVPNKDDFLEVESNFSALVQRACLTAGNELSEPLLTCVHIYENFIESCDNDRITICTLETELDSDVLVPAANLLEISKEDITHICIGDSWIHFKTSDKTILSTCLYNEEYVDLKKHIPDTEDSDDFIKLPKELSEILGRATIFSNDKISMENIVDINIKNKKLVVSAEVESKWFHEKTVIKTDKNISFSINADFLKDILEFTNKISIINGQIYFKLEDSIHIINLEDE